MNLWQKQVRNQGRVDLLGEDGVFRVAEKGLDPEVLFDESKKNSDLPAVLVKVGDGAGGQRHMVQEVETLPRLLVPIVDATQDQRLVPIGDLDHLIRCDAPRPVREIALKDEETGVPLEARNQKDAGLTKLSEPSVIDLPPVEGHNRALGQSEQLGDVGFGDAGLGGSKFSP